jgi:hypothetical protein
MPWDISQPTPRCDVCGRFFKLAALLDGTATHRMIEPDSDFTTESYETLCPPHSQGGD